MTKYLIAAAAALIAVAPASAQAPRKTYAVYQVRITGPGMPGVVGARPFDRVGYVYLTTTITTRGVRRRRQRRRLLPDQRQPRRSASLYMIESGGVQFTPSRDGRSLVGAINLLGRSAGYPTSTPISYRAVITGRLVGTVTY